MAAQTLHARGRALPRDPARRERARFRRSPPAHGRAARASDEHGPRGLPAALPVRPRRRVPGHEPHPVRADPAPGRATTATSPWSATRTSRSTPGGAPTSRTSWTSSTTSRARASCASRRTTGRRQAILDAASALVAHNEKRKGKTLRAVKTAGEAVRLHQAGDEYEEAAWVVEPHRRAARQGPRGRALPHERPEPSARRGALRHGLPYVVVGGVGFYERREVKDLLAYLRLVRIPTTPSRCGAWSTCRRGASERRTVEELERVAAAARAGRSWEALAAVDDEALPARARDPAPRALPRADGDACASEAAG